MVEGPRHDHGVVGHGAVGAGGAGVGDARTTRQDQLGPAGGAAGGGRLVEGGGAVLVRTVVLRQGQQGGHVIARLVALDGVAGDQDRRLGQVHDRLGLVLGQAVGDRLGRGADLPEREAGFHEVDAVGQADGHQVAVLDAGGHQAARQAVGAKVQLLPGDGAVLVGDGGAVGPLLRQVGETQAQGNRPAGFLVAHRRSLSLMQIGEMLPWPLDQMRLLLRRVIDGGAFARKSSVTRTDPSPHPLPTLRAGRGLGSATPA